MRICKKHDIKFVNILKICKYSMDNKTISQKIIQISEENEKIATIAREMGKKLQFQEKCKKFSQKMKKNPKNMQKN